MAGLPNTVQTSFCNMTVMALGGLNLANLYKICTDINSTGKMCKGLSEMTAACQLQGDHIEGIREGVTGFTSK